MGFRRTVLISIVEDCENIRCIVEMYEGCDVKNFIPRREVP